MARHEFTCLHALPFLVHRTNVAEGAAAAVSGLGHHEAVGLGRVIVLEMRIRLRYQRGRKIGVASMNLTTQEESCTDGEQAGYDLAVDLFGHDAELSCDTLMLPGQVWIPWSKSIRLERFSQESSVINWQPKPPTTRRLRSVYGYLMHPKYNKKYIAFDLNEVV